ncbi:MAG: YceI family protein [bacterium]
MVVSSTKGDFREFFGRIETDTNGVPTEAAVTIKAASVNTDNEDRDKHLRSPDFFDADNFPEVTFESTKIEKTDEGATIMGDLTIRGITRGVALPVSLSGPITDPWGNVRIGLEGSTMINRKAFGMVWSQVLDAGGVVVDDVVKIDVSVEAIKNK